MSNITSIFRDYVVDGNPSSGIWNPQKSDIRSWGSGVYSNTSTTVNSNYAVQTGDAGNTIVVTGSAPVTLTYGSPGSFASTHANFVVNQSSRRVSIDITSSGGGVVWVWPGNFAIVAQLNSAWYACANSPRYRYAGGQFFADAVYGLDTNDGLAAGPGGAKQTITAGIRSFLADIDFAGNQATLLVAAGTYTELPTVEAYPVGLAEVFFIQGASPGSVIWKPAPGGGTACCTIADGGTVEMTNITFDNTGGTGGAAAQIHQTGILDLLTGINFGNFPNGSHIGFDRGGGNCNISNDYTISGTAKYHALMGGGPAMLSIEGGINVNIPNTLTGMTQFFQIDGGGAINMGSGVNFTGAGSGTAQPGGQWGVAGNGWISKSGNTIPGNAGSNSVTTGGQVF